MLCHYLNLSTVTYSKGIFSPNCRLKLKYEAHDKVVWYSVQGCVCLLMVCHYLKSVEQVHEHTHWLISYINVFASNKVYTHMPVQGQLCF